MLKNYNFDAQKTQVKKMNNSSIQYVEQIPTLKAFGCLLVTYGWSEPVVYQESEKVFQLY
jgi:hypothetical protein